jgi:tetrahedral aminopeptidase
MSTLKTLEKLCALEAVSGFEDRVSEKIKKIFSKHCDEVYIDKFYNVIGKKNGKGNHSQKILVCAHYDEIGFIVKGIDDNGFLRLSTAGGIDPKILLAKEVMIHGKKDLIGIIGAMPPHLLKPEEAKKAVKIDDIYVDTGIGSQKIKEIVSIGDAVTFLGEGFALSKNRFSAKSVDNRAGVAALVECMEYIKGIDSESEADVYFVASVQEEVGLRGIITAAYNVEPDIAIVIDACHGNIPDAAKDEAYNLGKGPCIGIGPNLCKKLAQKLIKTAENENIPYQLDVEPGDTGTEAWAVQVSREGVSTALISIPVRYMHTDIETVDISDIKNTGKLVSGFMQHSDF